jgi:hypothetical protein
MIVMACFAGLQSTHGDRSAERGDCEAIPAQAPAHFPSFNRQLLLESTSETSANVSIGDLNGDGKLDILLVKGRHWPLISRVLLGDGKGHFPTAHNLGETAYRSYSGRLVDIDADGHPDVVLSNDAPDAKVIYLNDGKGNFRRASTYGHAEWVTRNVSVADLNGDGLPDIIVANRADNPKNAANYVCLNRGRGRFDADCTAFASNRDGKIDVLAGYVEAQPTIYFNDGAGRNFYPLRFGVSKGTGYGFAIDDLDRDGLLDIAMARSDAPNVVYFGSREP